MEGLAQTLAGPQAGGQGMPVDVSVEEVVALLMQGISPEKLVESGIPQELIMQAIAVLEQQMAAEQAAAQAQTSGEGLAGSLLAS